MLGPSVPVDSLALRTVSASQQHNPQIAMRRVSELRLTLQGSELLRRQDMSKIDFFWAECVKLRKLLEKEEEKNSDLCDQVALICGAQSLSEIQVDTHNLESLRWERLHEARLANAHLARELNKAVEVSNVDTSVGLRSHLANL